MDPAFLAALIASCAPQVHPLTMSALIRVESTGNPHAVSINRPKSQQRAGRVLPSFEQPRDAAAALDLAQRLHAQGFTTSIGLAQVNTEHLPALRLSLAQLLDPCTNLQVAELVLIDCTAAPVAYDEAASDAAPTTELSPPSLSAVLSCYNSGNTRTGIANGYTTRVASAAMALNASFVASSEAQPSQARSAHPAITHTQVARPPNLPGAPPAPSAASAFDTPVSTTLAAVATTVTAPAAPATPAPPSSPNPLSTTR